MEFRKYWHSYKTVSFLNYPFPDIFKTVSHPGWRIPGRPWRSQLDAVHSPAQPDLNISAKTQHIQTPSDHVKGDLMESVPTQFTPNAIDLTELDLRSDLSVTELMN